MNWIVAHKEELLGLISTVLVFTGAIIRLTASKKDDSVYNKIVTTIGLSNLVIPTAEAPPVEPPK